MKIRKRLIFSNLALILLPIILSVIFAILLFFLVGSRYWSPLGKMFSDNGNVYSAQSLIYAFGNEVSDYQWENFEENRNEIALDITDNTTLWQQTELMQRLEIDLNRMGYQLRVIRGEDEIYSNVDNSQVFNEYIGKSSELEDAVLSSEDEAFIKQSYGDLTVFAFKNSLDQLMLEQNYLEEYIFDYIVFFAIFVIITIALISIVISRMNSKMILVPLNKLKEGTLAISNGDLDAEIDYYKKDEFYEVCKSFNEMREHLKLSVNERLELESYRKRLIADISHDLRTPLTTIKGYTEALIADIPKTPEKRMQYYKAIQIRSNDLENLVNNLSTLSDFDNKNHQYSFTKVNIKDYIDNYVSIRKDEFESRKISVKIVHDKSKNVLVSLDENEFTRVFVNLIDNSCKYSESKKLKIVFSTKVVGDKVEICVSDNGKGAKSPEKIFDRFYREDEARTFGDDGHGLGLSIVQEIIEGHSGKISAENCGGLLVKISLPLAKRTEGN